ncbi:thyrotropin-releasing hormone receptor-like [Patiria miniata]|uniref:G-protein coupled receptors family 1 profile domain-containing protein n=1 Tax=Patiria miniata TaxID=46514 RepID=A0A913ZW39_PATMI|nr:thyrotropin-releasing hormone receptor-like [Patiria miniata]
MDLDSICNATQVYNFTQKDVAIYMYTDFVAAIVIGIMPCILVFGLISNLSFLLVVHRVKHMRTVTNYLLLQLALTDIVNLVVSIGERVWRYISSPVTFDQRAEGLVPGCILLPFLKAMSKYGSLAFLTLVTLEMYLAICKPIKHRSITTRSLTIKLTAACWAIATFVSVLRIPSHCVFKQFCVIWPTSREYQHLPNVVGNCVGVSDSVENASNAIQTTPFFVGLVVNTVLYARIMKILYRRRRVAASDQPIRFPVRARNQVAHMLVINYLAWFLLVSPFECLSLVSTFVTGRTQTFIDVTYLFRALTYLNSAVNPLIFYTVHPRYRKAFLKTCSQCFGYCRSDASQ